MKITMHPEEIDLFSSLLVQSKGYFEFGIGGSTCLAAKLTSGPIVGVESSKEWIDKVLDEIPIKADVKLKYVDIGQVGNWGTPTSRDAEDRFPNYSRAIRDPENPEIDFCLVDGRFRISCFLEALSHLHSDAVLAIHDYTSRPHYHSVEQFARPIARCRELNVFVRRRDCDMVKLVDHAEAHRFDWT